MLVEKTEVQAVETPIFINNLYSGTIDPAIQTSLESYSNNIISYNYDRQGMGQGLVIMMPSSVLWSLMSNKTLSCLSEDGAAGIYTDSTRLIGVLQEDGQEDLPVRIMVKGVAEILLEDSSAVTFGDWLIPSTTQAGRVVSAGQLSIPTNKIGFSLISVTSGTDKTTTALIDCQGAQ